MRNGFTSGVRTALLSGLIRIPFGKITSCSFFFNSKSPNTELFKTHKATPVIDGFVSVNGAAPVYVGSAADLKKIVADLRKV